MKANKENTKSRKEIYGEHHGDVAASYNNLGNVYRDLGQYNQAKEYHEKSLAIRKEIYGEHHGDKRQVTTTWELFTVILVCTIRLKNTVRSLLPLEKRFMARSILKSKELLTI